MGWIVKTSVHRLGCLSRRDVLGTLMINGISMGGVIGARSEAIYSKSSAPRAKSILVLFAGGGQSQFETWDPKPHAPAEIRGHLAPFKPGSLGCGFVNIFHVSPI